MKDTQKLFVRTVMNNEVQMISATETVQKAAQIMRDEEIGSVIIVESKESHRPIGIITERDMSNRVVAENKLPSKIQCKEIMSFPVKSISPTLLLVDAMHQMATQKVKRLVVMEKQKMVGIISQSDILEIAPYMIEVLQEKANLLKEDLQTEFLAGYCQLCDNWSDMLVEVDNLYICEECKAPKDKTEY